MTGLSMLGLTHAPIRKDRKYVRLSWDELSCKCTWMHTCPVLTGEDLWNMNPVREWLSMRSRRVSLKSGGSSILRGTALHSRPRFDLTIAVLRFLLVRGDV